MNVINRISTCFLSTNKKSVTTTFLRCWHAQPMLKHDVTRPEVDWSNYPDHEHFSEHVRSHIEARDLENCVGERRADVLNLQTGNSSGTVLLNDFVFGCNPRIDILHQNSVWYRACIRKGSAHTLDRSDKRGGGRKPWQQKGSGRARHGSRNSPIWHKGGVAHGPKPRLDLPDSVPGPKPFAYPLPYKVRRLGVRTALSCKLAQNDLTIVEDLNGLPGDKQEFAEMCLAYGFESTLMVDGFENEHLNYLMEGMHWMDSTDIMHLLVYSILQHHKLVLSLDAVRMIEERLCEDGRIINHPHYSLLHEDWMLPKDMLHKEYDPHKKFIRGPLRPISPKRNIKHLMSLSRRDTPYGQM